MTGPDRALSDEREDSVRGFILQPTYRLRGGKTTVTLFGVLEDGGTFAVLDDRSRPRFYVTSDARAMLEARDDVDLVDTGRIGLDGESLVRVEVTRPGDAPRLRELLRDGGFRVFEADVRFAVRYLIDRGIRGSMRIDGPWRPGRWVDRVYERPTLTPAELEPQLKVLSFDLETDPQTRHVLSCAIYSGGDGEVLVVESGVPPPNLPDWVRLVADERQLIEAIGTRFREIDPDVVTGWSIADFDLPVLLERARVTGARLELGRVPGATRSLQGRASRQATRYQVPGRVVLDGVQLLRSSFVKMERQSLDFVAREVLGEGKTAAGPDRIDQLVEWYEQDLVSFAEYNLTDARLVVDILERLRLVELAVARSRLTGLPLDRVSSAIAAFDFLYLTELRELGFAAPSVEPRVLTEPLGGGGMIKPAAGLYENVAVLDFKSLYPSLIRTFNIDPLSCRGAPRRSPEDPSDLEDLIVAPNGVGFSRGQSVLPGLLDDLFPAREAAKRSGDETKSQAIKILMNSFYGVFGATTCRFFSPDIANAITSFGRAVLRWCQKALEDRHHSVLYGDTDSLFVQLQAAEPRDCEGEAQHLVGELNAAVAEWLEHRWQVSSRLELEVEKVFRRLFLPPLRRSSEGAMKKYAGLVETTGESELVLVGLEAVRRDWTELAKRAQVGALERLFADRPIDEYLRQTVEQLRAGELDDLLVYRKGLRKDPAEYTTTTPPHVVAARKLSEITGERGRRRVVEYVMTVAGPEPAGHVAATIDYDHYIDRQLAPVTQPILAQLGLELPKVIGDDRQLSLF